MGSFSKVSVGVMIISSLCLGIWVNNTVWRNRKLVWQLQAALIGGSVGFVAGRLSR
jgi:hypothetical protein